MDSIKLAAQEFAVSKHFLSEFLDIECSNLLFIPGDIVIIDGTAYKATDATYIFVNIITGTVCHINIDDIEADDIVVFSPPVHKVFDKYRERSINEFGSEGFTVNKVDIVIPEFFNNLDYTKIPQHPGITNAKIYDIMHPSRYLTHSRFKTVNSSDCFQRKYSNSNYTWVAHRVNKGKIIDKIAKPELQDLLEMVLAHQMTGFDRAWKYVQLLANTHHDKSMPHTMFKNSDDYKPECNKSPNQAIDEFNVRDLPDNLQVYIKVIDMHLENNDEYYTGVWHMEGLPEEHIIATGLCYLPTSVNVNISFKRDYHPGERSYLFWNADQSPAYSWNSASSQHIPMGNLNIESDTEKCQLAVFPNSHFHQVNPIETEFYYTKRKITSRKLVVFFLVNPDVTVADFDNTPVDEIIDTMQVDADGKSFYHPALLETMEARRGNKELLNCKDIEFCEH